MASNSETGFGIKIRKAQDLILAINSFPIYEPPREEESIVEMTSLVESIIHLNADETVLKENYRMAVNDRRIAFHGRSGSVDRLLSPVASAVGAQYGSDSKYAGFVKELVRKLRSHKPSKSQGSGTKPPASKSEHSYGAMTKTFYDLVLTLTQFADYNPSNTAITIETLEQKVQELTALNDGVTEKALALKSTKDQRAENYRILKERVARIKMYIKAQYGNQSPQYSALRTLKL